MLRKKWLTGLPGLTWIHSPGQRTYAFLLRKRSRYSYYSGRSTGGRQGLKEAEMFPDDFDGIVAECPAWWTTHLQLWNMKVGLYNLPTTAPYHIPPALFPVIGAAVLEQCDPQDGLVDNIISDPARRDFHPETLLCGPDVGNVLVCIEGRYESRHRRTIF